MSLKRITSRQKTFFNEKLTFWTFWSKQRTFHLHRYDNPHNQDCYCLKPAKLVVVPGALIGGLKVHLLCENRKPKLIGVQFKL